MINIYLTAKSKHTIIKSNFFDLTFKLRSLLPFCDILNITHFSLLNTYDHDRQQKYP